MRQLPAQDDYDLDRGSAMRERQISTVRVSDVAGRACRVSCSGAGKG